MLRKKRTRLPLPCTPLTQPATRCMSLDTAPANNTVRRLRWLRKCVEKERHPHAHFPLTLYV